MPDTDTRNARALLALLLVIILAAIVYAVLACAPSNNPFVRTPPARAVDLGDFHPDTTITKGAMRARTRVVAQDACQKFADGDASEIVGWISSGSVRYPVLIPATCHEWRADRCSINIVQRDRGNCHAEFQVTAPGYFYVGDATVYWIQHVVDTYVVIDMRKPPRWVITDGEKG